MFDLFLKLIFAHAIADFLLQPDKMAKYKSSHTPPSKNLIPKGEDPQSFWIHFLLAHAMINGAAIYALTSIAWMAFVEIFVHAYIDYQKCESKISIHQDQLLHLLSKIIYILILSQL